MQKGQDLFNFANKHKLKIGKIEDLIAYRLKKEKLIKLKKQSSIIVKDQKYNIRIYEKSLFGMIILAPWGMGISWRNLLYGMVAPETDLIWIV